VSRLKALFKFIAILGFLVFLAGYWYLVHALHLHFAIVGAVAACTLFYAVHSRLPQTAPQPILLVCSALFFFLMLNPLPHLRGIGQMLWFTASALLFGLSFSRLDTSPKKAGALALSYLLFLALPLGLPRLGPATPTASADTPLEVAVIGAGFGGIAMGKELLDTGVTNFQIFEAAPEVGGTWYHNRYPGLHVDVMSALYSFSFFPNPNWSKLWAPRAELHDYAVRASEAFGVRPFVQFNTWVKGLTLNEDTGLWEVALADRTVLARHVIAATGGLHIPNVPNFPGLDSFEGVAFHSARWREDLDLSDKRIAIIGSGASAVQIIPELAKEAALVDMYQRTPNWVAPQDNQAVSGLRQWIYAYVPMAFRLERLRTHVFSELGFRATFPLDSPIRGRVEEELTRYIKGTIKDQELAEKMVPDYEFGCKRPLVTGHFYASLNRPNVDVITEGIAGITPTGIRSNEGIARKYDVIILATGYKVAQLPFSITGRNSVPLEELWKEKPLAYESVMVNGFPNLYLMSGPNSGVIGSIIIHIETSVKYIQQVIAKATDAYLIEPKKEAQQTYNQNLQKDLKNTVWAGSCKSWYKLDDGHVIANHPHPVSKIVYERTRPRWEDLSIVERRQTGEQP